MSTRQAAARRAAMHTVTDADEAYVLAALEGQAGPVAQAAAQVVGMAALVGSWMDDPARMAAEVRDILTPPPPALTCGRCGEPAVRMDVSDTGGRWWLHTADRWCGIARICPTEDGAPLA